MLLMRIFTIGAFYKEISDCITILGNSIFDRRKLDRQVHWPWDPTDKVGSLVLVTDSASAEKGINVIMTQGEGADPLNPKDAAGHTLAHFFKFEEIFCKRQLKKVSKTAYAYAGAPITFRAEGVWPMRNDPSVGTVPPDTNCYTESRVFHQVYRALLRKLQEVFNGSPDEIKEAITLMESLQVHAKKLMWTKFNPNSNTDDTTCGPVWDYYWPEVIMNDKN